jgi:hypothetical protein
MSIRSASCGETAPSSDARTTKHSRRSKSGALWARLASMRVYTPENCEPACTVFPCRWPRPSSRCPCSGTLGWILIPRIVGCGGCSGRVRGATHQFDTRKKCRTQRPSAARSHSPIESPVAACLQCRPMAAGREWWAHFEFTRINIEPIILRKKSRTCERRARRCRSPMNMPGQEFH